MTWICPDKPCEADISFLDEIDETEFIAQSKINGYRTISFCEIPVLYSRNHILLSRAIKKEVKSEITEAVKVFGNSTLDGEYVLRRTSHPESLYLFDIISNEGSLMLNVPFEERWHTLREIYKNKLQGNEYVMLVDYVDENFKKFFNSQKKLDGLSEGIVIKKRKSTITGNRKDSSVNNKEWFKVRF